MRLPALIGWERELELLVRAVTEPPSVVVVEGEAMGEDQERRADPRGGTFAPALSTSLWRWNSELAADRADSAGGDLAVSWHRGTQVCWRMAPDRVAGAFA